MRSLTALLHPTAADRTPVAAWPLENILRLPHTLTLQALLATVALDDPGGLDRLRRLERQLVDAHERDLLAADLPPGCWCYGAGGKDERAVLLPGDEVPLVLSTYCGCAIGQVRKLADDDLRQQSRTWQHQARLMGIWEGARIPERFAACSFATFPSSPTTDLTIASLRAWLLSPGWAIVLMGNFGVGKTGLAISALREVAELQRRPGLFVKTPDLLARIKATYAKDATTTEATVLDSLRTVDYLVLDDIGADKDTDWATSMLFQVLDDRHDHQRKTIVTTNLDHMHLGMHLGARTMRRFEEDTVFLTVDGPNLRRSDAA
jgi:DNA replication protein DnaC